MRKNIALLMALVMGLSTGTALVADSASAQESTRTQRARASKQRARAENSSTCRGEAKQDSVTKGAAYGGVGGLLLGGPVGAIVGAGAGAGVQKLQNNAACGR